MNNFEEVFSAQDKADKYLNYGIALQRAIEQHCRGLNVSEQVAKNCPFHARLLDEFLAEVTKVQQ